MSFQAEFLVFFRACAFASVGLVLWRYFRATHTTALGALRWALVALLFAAAGFRLFIIAGVWLGRPAISSAADFAGSLCVVGVALVLHPLLRDEKSRRAHSMRHSVRGRVRRAEAKLAQSTNWLQLAEEIAHVGHWTVSLPGQQVFWSDEIYRIHGLEKSAYAPEIVSAVNVFHPDDRDRLSAHIATAIAEHKGYEFHARLIRPDGEIRQVLSRGLVQLDGAGKPVSIFGVFIDITEQKQIEQKLEAAILLAGQANDALKIIAHSDGLTGLPNRREFDKVLDVELRRAIREQTPTSLIMVDLDHFKSFNDFYGHPAGDDCLRRVATAISGALRRPADLVARYGGEEIGIILPNTDLPGAKIMAESVLETVRALRIAHEKSGVKIVTVSCGVAVLETATDISEQAWLVKRADMALYHVKKTGRNAASAYTDETRQMAI